MTKRTPLLELTVPDINDYIAAWPGIAEQGFLDLENSLLIDLHSADDAYDTYPIGMSLFGVTSTNAPENGWPAGSGMVISWRRPQGNSVFQLKVSQGVDRIPNVYARTGFPPDASGVGWSPWGTVISRDRGVATGLVTFNDVAYNTTVETTVALPSGMFTAAPGVVVSTQTNAPANWMACVGSTPTASSFEIGVSRRAEGTGNISVQWQAIQTAPGVEL